MLKWGEYLNKRVALIFLVITGHIEIMKILLGKGVDGESECESGTPLVWAAGHG